MQSTKFEFELTVGFKSFFLAFFFETFFPNTLFIICLYLNFTLYFIWQHSFDHDEPVLKSGV